MSNQQHSESLAMIERLVAFPTVSANSNLDLIHDVRDYLAGHGIASRLTFDADRRKANLFATVGPEIAGGIVLSGHTDVVPVAGQPWDTDPFKIVRRDGRLYGRGAADMKSFIAVALALVPEFKAAKLRVPIHLALSYDEEVGCTGVSGMLDDIAANLPRPALAIIGEPTGMQIANRHKGYYAHKTVFTGRDGHSSATHKGLNAISHAAELIGFLSKLEAELRRDGPFDDSFDPPYSTFNVGMISGGTAMNIIARSCEVTWEFRPLPSVEPAAVIRRVEQFLQQDLLPRMRRSVPEAGIESERLCVVAPLRAETDSPAEALVRLLTGANQSIGVAFGTEGGLFQQAGIPAVVCGPGDIAQAHQPNEFIALDQVEACVVFLRKLLDWARRR